MGRSQIVKGYIKDVDGIFKNSDFILKVMGSY